MVERRGCARLGAAHSGGKTRFPKRPGRVLQTTGEALGVNQTQLPQVRLRR
jgi:hypothetical protein